MRYRSSHSYKSFHELTKNEPQSSYNVMHELRDSPLAFIAPHGGFIEPKTPELCKALAGEQFSYAIFECLDMKKSEAFHISSHLFDEPQSLSVAKNAQVVISVHGCLGDEDVIYMGGLHKEMTSEMSHTLIKDGFNVQYAPRYAGKHPKNICNRGLLGKGVQLELTRSLRSKLFSDEKWWMAKQPTPLFDQLVNAIRQASSKTIHS